LVEQELHLFNGIGARALTRRGFGSTALALILFWKFFKLGLCFKRKSTFLTVNRYKNLKSSRSLLQNSTFFFKELSILIIVSLQVFIILPHVKD
jgi:hypothetical protein